MLSVSLYQVCENSSIIHSEVHFKRFLTFAISDVALVGGGTFPQPGEIPLGHNGLLFLDDRPELKRTVLEVMRQPPEDRVITISRAKSTVDYPAS